jgi:signal transduction histidine kinase
MRLTRIQRSRLTLVSLLAVAFIPASALAYLQYRALSEVQQQTKLTMNANLQQALLGAREEAVTDLARWPDQALLGYDIHDYLRRGQKDRMKDVADTARRICPYIGYFFSIRLRKGTRPEISILRPRQAQRHMEYFRDDQVEADVATLVSSIKITNSHTYLAYVSIGGERQQVFLHLVDDDGDEPKLPHINQIGYVGFAIQSEFLANSYFGPLLKKHLARLASSSSDIFDNQAEGAIFDGGGKRVGSSPPEVSGPFTVQERISKRMDVLPGWTMRAELSKGTAVLFDQTHFARGVSVFFMITGILIAALVMIGMTTARELEVSRTKTEFVASMSHEFKTPLSIIRGFVETLHLNRVRDDFQREEYFRIIEAEIHRLSNMIDRVLEVSKIEAGLKHYEPEVVNVGELIEETLTSLSHELDKKAFLVERDIEIRLPEAHVDPLAFSQALLNLITNAVKYSDTEKKIVVRAVCNRDRLEISVSDCGIGIPKREQVRIFERFYRAGQSAAKTAGAGLGLSLVKHFAEAHGGEVRVTSAPGKGSMFVICLPVNPLS